MEPGVQVRCPVVHEAGGREELFLHLPSRESDTRLDGVDRVQTAAVLAFETHVSAQRVWEAETGHAVRTLKDASLCKETNIGLTFTLYFATLLLSEMRAFFPTSNFKKRLRKKTSEICTFDVESLELGDTDDDGQLAAIPDEDILPGSDRADRPAEKNTIDRLCLKSAKFLIASSKCRGLREHKFQCEYEKTCRTFVVKRSVALSLNLLTP